MFGLKWLLLKMWWHYYLVLCEPKKKFIWRNKSFVRLIWLTFNACYPCTWRYLNLSWKAITFFKFGLIKFIIKPAQQKLFSETKKELKWPTNLGWLNPATGTEKGPRFASAAVTVQSEAIKKPLF